MAYEFQKLSEVEALAEVPEGANALIEVNGDIKRVPGSGLGGATGIKTAIIKTSDYDEMLTVLTGAVIPKDGAPVPEITCINMTFEEAYQTMVSGEPLNVISMVTYNGMALNFNSTVCFAGSAVFGIPCICIDVSFIDSNGINNLAFLFWTPDGISTDVPNSGVPA